MPDIFGLAKEVKEKSGIFAQRNKEQDKPARRSFAGEYPKRTKEERERITESRRKKVLGVGPSRPMGFIGKDVRK